ncbi:MAG TPA: tetratricopeptide repeat protein [Dokdonella sp.]|nr:tetratricopeptide repeat protein [Dokdonella sp.]
MTRDRDFMVTATGIHEEAGLAAGTLVAERFRIERQLGIGGMGVVYLATDIALDVKVAIKLLRPDTAQRPESFERFKQELLLAREVSSPHVVRIHDIAVHESAGHDRRWLISMAYIDGQSLERVIDSSGPMDVEEALRITRQLAVGLAAAHARDVIHRDLKPANVLLDKDGTAYISDFGVARSLRISGLTQTGGVIGTPDYLSPEQARGAPVDGRSDLYALGLLLYEMLAGKPAFSGGTSAESLTQRLLGPPPPIRKLRSDVPTWVEALLDRLLRPSPAQRLPNAEAVVAAIDQRKVPRDLRPGRRSLIAAVILLGLGFGGLLFWYWPERGLLLSPPPDRLLVMPIVHDEGDADLEPALAGYAEHLRQGLAALDGAVVVDGERTNDAITRIGIAASVAKDPALLAAAAASQVLRTRLVHVADGYRFSATISSAEGQPITIAPASRHADVIEAARAFDAEVTTAWRPGQAFPADLLPRSETALAAYGRGLLDRRGGRMDSAITQFSAAIAEDAGYSAAYLGLARAARDSGRADAARDALDKGLQARGSATLRPAMLELKALVEGDPDAAIASLTRYLAVHPDDLDAGRRLATLQGESGDFEPALERLQALSRRDAEDPRLWFLLGKYSILHGNLRPAVEDYLVRAMVLFKRSRNVYGESETVNALGVGYARLGQTADAEEQYRKAVQLRRALGNTRGVATTLRNLAQLATIRGQFAEAQQQLAEARDLFASLGDQAGSAAVDNEIGLLAEEEGKYADALAAFKRALQMREREGDRQGIAESQNNIGYAHFVLGDYDSAQVFWQQSLATSNELDDPAGTVRAQQNLGLLYLQRGRWQEARALLEESLATAQQRQMIEEAAVSGRNLAELEILEGRLADALGHIGRARRLFAEREDQRGLVDIGLLQARLQLGARDRAAALATLDELDKSASEASAEQKASTLLLRAEAGKGDADTLEAARKLAEQSGVRALLVQVLIALRQASADEVRALGNLPLQLDWLVTELGALPAADKSRAVQLYGEARALLRDHPDALAAFDLHRLGSRVLLGSDPALAEEARRDAGLALKALRDGATPAQRQSIDADPVVAAFEGATHDR